MVRISYFVALYHVSGNYEVAVTTRQIYLFEIPCVWNNEIVSVKKLVDAEPIRYIIQCSAQVFKRAGCHLKRAL